MQDVMLDLETWGTRPGCSLRSIGAIFFDPHSNALGAEFYINVDQASCELLGLTIDANTVAWWKRQSLQAQAALLVDPKPLDFALQSFTSFFSTHGGERIWSHGANFDQPILEACYPLIGMNAPWSFWNSRCTRTLYDVAGVDTRKMSAGEVKHNALDDARIQARAAQACFARLRGAMPPPISTIVNPTTNSTGVFG